MVLSINYTGAVIISKIYGTPVTLQIKQMTEEQFLLFAAYINNELTPQQDAELVELLTGSPQLMQEFEMELMLRRSINKGDLLSKLSQNNTPGLEPADTFIANTTKALEQNSAQQEFKHIVPFTRRYRPLLAAAAVILIVLMVWLFATHKPENNIVKKNDHTPGIRDIPRDSGIAVHKDKNSNTKENNISEELYAANYQPYRGGIEDPVELGIQLNDYKEKKYKKVIALKKEDYETRGSGDTLLSLYADFYIALSYLETGNTTKASGLLNQIAQSKETTQTLRYNCNWYRAMAALKNNDITTCTQMLEVIKAQPKSPWQKNAADLLIQLDSIK